jgi:hypothetical protein
MADQEKAGNSEGEVNAEGNKEEEAPAHKVSTSSVPHRASKCNEQNGPTKA